MFLATRNAGEQQLLEFMRRHGLTADDLAEVGGQDLCSSSLSIVRKAQSVEKCWALMARLSVTHEALFPDWTARGGITRLFALKATPQKVKPEKHAESDSYVCSQ